MSEPRAWALDLPYARFDRRGVKHPTPPITLNSRMNRHAERELKKRIRHEVGLLARSAHVPALTAGIVTLVWRPRRAGTRDNDNLAPTLKPAVDGLVDVGVFTDDNSSIVRSRTLVLPAGKPVPGLWLHILECPDGLPPDPLDQAGAFSVSG